MPDAAREGMLPDRVAQYAYRYWMRHNMEEWPEVRTVARALRVKQADIDDHQGYGTYTISQYNTDPPQPLGNGSVEAMIPEVDAAWEAYYARTPEPRP